MHHSMIVRMLQEIGSRCFEDEEEQEPTYAIHDPESWVKFLHDFQDATENGLLTIGNIVNPNSSDTLVSRFGPCVGGDGVASGIDSE